MMVIGGKITMTFGKAWLDRVGKPQDSIRDPRPLLALMVLLFVALYTLPSLSMAGAWRNPIIVILAFFCGVICCVRLVGWRAWTIKHEVDVVQISIGLRWVPLSLFWMAAWKFGFAPNNAWVHAISVGGMGTLLLAVMSRVALARTGRRGELAPLAQLGYRPRHTAGL